MLPADMPVDLTAMLGPMMGMVKAMGANMFAMQAGQGLAALAGEVLGAGDVGLPLTPDGVPTLLPENVAAFGAGLEIEPGEIALYLALREVAHQRLFTHVSWLGPTVRDAVAAYARGHRAGHRCDGGEAARHRHDQPGQPPGGAGLRGPGPRGHPRAEGRARPPGDAAGPRRGLGGPRRGRRHRRSAADRGQAAGGRAPSSRGGRSGREDVPDPRRPRDAPTSAARGRGAVGRARARARRVRARRRLGAPRPAARPGRPRRPHVVRVRLLDLGRRAGGAGVRRGARGLAGGGGPPRRSTPTRSRRRSRGSDGCTRGRGRHPSEAPEGRG